MLKTFLRCVVPSLLSAYGLLAAAGQAVSKCGPPPVVAANAHANMFNIDQERWLGEAERDEMESSTEMVGDASLNDHLQSIVDRLAKNLPQPHVPFHVVLYESPEVNGFSIAGGSIYISRKLASVVKSDDELAAVLGHEMGHIASHQFAFEMTVEFQGFMHVTGLGDRKDVYSKYQQLYDAEMADKHPLSQNEDAGQDEADRVGVYLVAAAGYRPQAFAEFWDRTQFVQGKTGSRWTDFFGMTKPDQKRLRGMQAMIAALPAGCGDNGRQPGEQEEFEVWQKRVLENRRLEAAAGAEDVPLKLQDVLRIEMKRVRFSHDGKYLLAQNESSVYVLDRSPLAVRFRIDASDAQDAAFTPDSSRVTFLTDGLRSEVWRVADGKLDAVHDPISPASCAQSILAPDGRSIFCLTYSSEDVGAALLDSSSGEVLWAKKGFFSDNTYVVMMTNMVLNGAPFSALMYSISPDGNTFIAGQGDEKIAIDFRTRTEIHVGSMLEANVTGAFTFVGNDQIAGVNIFQELGNGVFSFPDGRQIGPLKTKLGDMQPVTNPGGKGVVLSTSLLGSAKNPEPTAADDARYQDRISLIDVVQGKLLAGTRSSAMDYFDGMLALESAAGQIATAQLENGHVSNSQTVAIPSSPLGGLRAVALSDDGNFLAYSTRDRGGIWDLSTGKRMSLMQEFVGPVWTDDGKLIASFKKGEKNDRQLVMFDPKTSEGSVLTNRPITRLTSDSFGHYLEWADAGKKSKTLTVRLLTGGGASWSKTFADGYPAMTASLGWKAFIFSYGLSSAGAKTLLQSNPELAAKANAVHRKESGRVVEIVNAETGSPLGKTVLELPADYRGTDGLNCAGDLLYVTGGRNRTLVYSLKTGARLWEAFGWVGAVDEKSGRVGVINRHDEIVIYDSEGQELLHRRLSQGVRFAQIEQGGAHVTVLLADQSVLRLNLPSPADAQ